MTRKVVSPIALDKSINTTEPTPRNIADVLAQQLAAIKTAIESGNGNLEAAFVCYYGVTTATQIKDAIEDGKVPYFYYNGAVAQLWKVETDKYTFRTTNTRSVEGQTILDVVDYVVNGSVWSTITREVSGGSSSGQSYIASVNSLADFDTTGKSGMNSVLSIDNVPADGVYQLSVMLHITPKTASATKSDLVFQFTGGDGTGWPNHTFHAVVDDSQTFAQQLSFSTSVSLKAGQNTLRIQCGNLNTEYLVFVDELTLAQLVNGVYHNGDDFDEVHTLTEALNFNNDDGFLVDGATGGPRFMFWQTLANKVLGFIKSLSTTITAFRTGDVIPVDGPSGTAKMGKDDLLRVTAENAAASGLITDVETFTTATGYPYNIKTTWTDGYKIVSNGSLFADPNRSVTPFLACIEGLTLTSNGRTGGDGGYAFYSANDSSTKISFTQGNLIDVVVPAGAKYFRITNRPSLIPNSDVTIKAYSVDSTSIKAQLSEIFGYTGKTLPFSDVYLYQGTVNDDGSLNSSGSVSNIRVSNGGTAVNVSNTSYVHYDVGTNYRVAFREWDGPGTSTIQTGGFRYGSGDFKPSHPYIFFIFAKPNDENISVADVRADCVIEIKDNVTKNTSDVARLSDSVGVGTSYNEIKLFQGALGDDGSVNASSIRVCNGGQGAVDSRNCDFVTFNLDYGYNVIIEEWDGVNNVTIKSPWLSGSGLWKLTMKDKVLFSFRKSDNSTINVSDVITHCKVAINDNVTSLVAEMGIVRENMPELNENKISYVGEKIKLVNYCTFKKKMTIANWQDSQGGAVYGDYLVSVMACDEIDRGNTNGHIYNLATGTKVCDLSFDSILNGVTYELPHANCVCFGNEFYNESSDFPLLYVSQVNGGSSALWEASERGVLVYDLQSDGLGGYTPVLVQVIRPDLSTAEKISAVEDKIGKYTPNYVVDTDNDKIVILGYPEASWYTGYGNGMPIAIMDLPNLADGSDIVFDADDISDYYKVKMSFAIQQPFYLSGKVYAQGGFAGATANRGIQVIDLNIKKRVTCLITTPHQGEPQFVGMWNEKCVWYDAGVSGDIYEVIF